MYLVLYSYVSVIDFFDYFKDIKSYKLNNIYYYKFLGGYNYFGTEQMYSGVDGRAMKASIFFGVVHYQRLRHMVSDKWQVIIS